MSLQERAKEIIHRWKFTCTIPNEDFDEVIDIVREYYGYKDSDITMIGSAHESDIRADEREIIHDIITKTVPNTVIRLWLHDVMKAIRGSK